LIDNPCPLWVTAHMARLFMAGICVAMQYIAMGH